MTMLLGVADRLAASPPPRGRVVLLFQPAEETGEGAARVLADSRFAGMLPDWAFAVHNLPGAEEGAVVIREGCMAAGSSGFVARFIGCTAHAAHPEKARSPAAAVAQVVLDLEALNNEIAGGSGLSLCTVIHARVGGPAFGTTPGEAEVMATVRSDSVDVLGELKRGCEEIARKHAVAHSLGLEIDWREEFPPTFNHPEAVRMVVAAAKATGLDVESRRHPLRWSEDFGHFTARRPGALIGLGVGRNHPPLHAPDYDFPDSLIPVGTNLLDALARCSAPPCTV